ncbi:MAG: DUF4160 domain-containing protein [Planctomycetota bacterium]|nr:DUF4160 domain-containing protein [Planctomycetota bacterium]
MPKISEFYGISIYMYYRDHPPPHFHAIYAGNEIQFEIGALAAMAGHLPPRALGLVVEWASQHQDELRRNWEHAEAGRPLERIRPLN